MYWTLGGFGLGLLTALVAWNLYGLNSRSAENHLDYLGYEANLIPLYQEKSEVIGHILALADIQDVQIQGIRTHIPQWRIVVSEDLHTIEELHAALDVFLSGHMGDLMHSEYRDRQLHAQMQRLRKIDGNIRKTRSDLGLN